MLAQHRFLLAPLGNGPAVAQLIEAVMMMTIPIRSDTPPSTTSAYGLPIVLVDDWAEVTPAKLEQWWAELSPRLEAARWVGTNRGMDSLLNGSCWRPQAGAGAATPITDRNESSGMVAPPCPPTRRRPRRHVSSVYSTQSLLYD